MSAENKTGEATACSSCRFFNDDPGDFERAFPGILILSSGLGDTKGNQGICGYHRQMCYPNMKCGYFQSSLHA